jgi:uncharacterized protein (TIGR02246 family)
LTSPEAEIRALLDEQAAAMRVKDVDRIVAAYAPDVLLFDVVDPLRARGLKALRERLVAWFGSFDGPIGYEVRDVEIAAGEEVGYSHGLNRVSATTTDGRSLEMWWRVTACYRRQDGVWRITHQHASVPFEPASGRASVGLEP